MAVAIGAIVVLAAVLAGFTLAGGNVGALLHLSEFIIIGGASMGALIIMSPKIVLRNVGRGIVQALKGSPFTKPTCMELLRLLYAVTRLMRKDGLLALDSHLSDPDASELFRQHPLVFRNHHLRHFVCDALSLLLDGKGEAAGLSAALDEEIKVVEREHHAAVAALSKTADSLPGFGIVAAVLGIVVTMQAIDGPVEQIGYKVGAALVGTFLGILMAYGFFTPIAGRLEAINEQETVCLRAIAAGVVAMSEGASPRDVVTRARRVLGSDCRPQHAELKELLA